MIDDRGLFDFAIQRPGPANKQYGERNRNEGIVFHSGEGYLASLLSTLDRASRQASWTGTIARNGILYQHYPTTASIWASGARQANTRFIAFELEGFASEPANREQTATILRIIRDCEAKFGWKAERRETIWEHREMHDLYGAPETACPSGRYDAVWDILSADTSAGLEEDMADTEARERLDRLNAAIVNRERLRRLASDPDYTRVEKALEILKAGGMEL